MIQNNKRNKVEGRKEGTCGRVALVPPHGCKPNGKVVAVLSLFAQGFDHAPSATFNLKKQVSLFNLFFLLNMLWSRHVKPSPAIGEKSERSEIRDIKVCTD